MVVVTTVDPGGAATTGAGSGAGTVLVVLEYETQADAIIALASTKPCDRTLIIAEPPLERRTKRAAAETVPHRAYGQLLYVIFASTGRMYSRNFAGFSLMGKWPSSFMISTCAPGIWSAVRRVSSGVQEKSYSPVSR